MKTQILKTMIVTLLVANSLLGAGYATASPNAVEADQNAGLDQANVNISSCQIFPDNNFWNVPIDGLPVHAQSSNWINSIGASTTFHMDFGSGNWDGGPIGIPYNVVSGSAASFYNFAFYYPDESDPGPYPLPANPLIEWGSDHHILTIDTDTCKLYEVYDASTSGGQWSGGSGAIWDMDSNALRTDTWTSADAAGLPILPGLARYDEVAAGVIAHALRFTANCSANNYIWPARHKAQSGSCANPVPFGARFRLKSNFDISGYSHDAQVLLQAFKTYGIVLADNGSNWYVSGAPSSGWNNDVLHELDNVQGSDFEAVDTSGLMVDPNSGETNYSATPHVQSIERMDGNPSSSTTFRFKVYFSESVTGVDAADFSLVTTGDISNAQITSVTGTGLAYIVTVSVDGGFGTIKLNLADNDSIQDGSGNPLGGAGLGNGDFIGGETYMRVAATLITFTGKGKNDGWILESTENSSKGGSMDSTSSTLNLGDNAAKKQYRSLLHFDTTLPSGAVIISAVLKVKKQGITGGNPFGTHGNLIVDIRIPSFGNASLQLTDFASAASKSQAATFSATPVDNWYSAQIGTPNLGYINTAGATQFRLRFSKDDDNDFKADIIKFFSGNATSLAARPKLIIEYYIP
jgi:hypothetical protein